jgi:hypothetical protein
MASILKVDELQGITSAGDITITSEGGAATQSLQQGLVKFWMLLNGTGTIALGDSFNLSSVTDNSTGQYFPNLTSAFVDTNYSVCSGDNERGVGESNYRTSSQAEVIVRNSSFSAVDANRVSATSNGDLA